jgi:hypothetical protein
MTAAILWEVFGTGQQKKMRLENETARQQQMLSSRFFS